jgi:hypothetical protein
MDNVQRNFIIKTGTVKPYSKPVQSNPHYPNLFKLDRIH